MLLAHLGQAEASLDVGKVPSENSLTGFGKTSSANLRGNRGNSEAPRAKIALKLMKILKKVASKTIKGAGAKELKSPLFSLESKGRGRKKSGDVSENWEGISVVGNDAPGEAKVAKAYAADSKDKLLNRVNIVKVRIVYAEINPEVLGMGCKVN